MKIRSILLVAAVGLSTVQAQFPQPGPMSQPDHWQTDLWFRSLIVDHINSYRAEIGLPLLQYSVQAEADARSIINGNIDPTLDIPVRSNTTTFILPSIAYTTGQYPFPTPPEFDVELAFYSAASGINGLLRSSIYDFSGGPPPEVTASWKSIGVADTFYSSNLSGNELIYSAVTRFSSEHSKKSALSEILPGAMYMSPNWYYSAWLGSIYVDTFPIVFQWGVGMLYFDSNLSNGYFLRYWDPGLGWLQTTTRHAYQGFYWSETEQDWIYRALSSTWPRIVYSYKRQTWDFVY